MRKKSLRHALQMGFLKELCGCKITVVVYAVAVRCFGARVRDVVNPRVVGQVELVN